MSRRAPKGVKHWNEDLIQAAQFRYHKAERENKRNVNHWRKAVELLQATRATIYIQKTGENANCIRNMPGKINYMVAQILEKVVRGEVPVVEGDPVQPSPMRSSRAVVSPELSTPHDFNVPVEMTRFYRNRKYGDCYTALLAGMYSSLRPQPGWTMTQDHIQNSASRFTEARMTFNRHTGEYGAWKGMEKLVEENLVNRNKKGYGVKIEYSLTLKGLLFCRALFSKKLHPSNGAPRLVESPYAYVDEYGNVHPRGVKNESIYSSADTSPESAQHKIYHDAVKVNISSPKLPDKDTLRALRLSKLEHDVSKTPSNTLLLDEEDDMAQTVLMSGCNVSSSDIPRMDKSVAIDDTDLERVLKLSKQETGNELQAVEDAEMKQALELSHLLCESFNEEDADVREALEISKLESEITDAQGSTFDANDNAQLEKALALSARNPHNLPNRKFESKNECMVQLSSVNVEVPSSVPTSIKRKRSSNAIDIISEPRKKKRHPHKSKSLFLDLSVDGDFVNSKTLQDEDVCEVQKTPFSTSSSAVFDLTNEDRDLDIGGKLSKPTKNMDATINLDIDIGNTNESHNVEFELLVDTSERLQEKTYRELFEAIRHTLSQYLSNCSAESQRLQYGDYQCVARSLHDHHQYCLDFIVERKTIQDIVSRSNDTRCVQRLAGPHFRQATALQYCGLSFPFFLIEGDVNRADAVRPALVDYVGQISVDRIESSHELLTFLAQMLNRSWSKHRIFLLQTWHPRSTSLFLTCMAYFAQKKCAKNGLDRLAEHYPSMNRFKADPIAPKSIKGMYQDLFENGIHPEMCARVVRRFGSWKHLKEALMQCGTAPLAIVLLSQLSPSSLRRKVFEETKLSYGDMDDDSNVFNESCMIKQSMEIVRLVIGRFPNDMDIFGDVDDAILFLNSTKIHVTRSTLVERSDQLNHIFQQLNADTDGIVVTDSSLAGHSSLPWVSITTSSYCHDESGNLRKHLMPSASRQRVIVIPGVDMMVALILSRETIGPPATNIRQMTVVSDEQFSATMNEILPYCYNIVQCAIDAYISTLLPEGWTLTYNCQTHSAIDSSEYHVILEDFVSPISTHATSGRLAKALSNAEENHKSMLNSSSLGNSSSCGSDSFMSQNLAVESCKDISMLINKILPVLVYSLHVDYKCTVMQTKNRGKTSEWVEMYSRAHHEEVLLFN